MLTKPNKNSWFGTVCVDPSWFIGGAIVVQVFAGGGICSSAG